MRIVPGGRDGRAEGLCSGGRLLPAAFAAAARQVVVHEPRGLQEGVADRRSEEFESSLFHVPAHWVMMPKVVGVVLDQMTRIVRFWSFAFLNNSIIAVQEKIPLYKVLKMLFRESAMDS